MVFKNGEHEGGVPYTLKAEDCNNINDLGFTKSSI